MSLTKNQYNEQTIHIIFVIAIIYVFVLFTQMMTLNYTKQIPNNEVPIFIDAVFGDDFNQTDTNKDTNSGLFPILQTGGVCSKGFYWLGT